MAAPIPGPPTIETNATTIPDSAFARDVVAVMRRLRMSLAALIASVNGDVTQPQEMMRQFGLDKNLAWKLSRIVRETEPAAAMPHIPGRPGIGIVLRRFTQAGAPEAVVTEARRAFKAFDELVETHSGDRETLEMMLGPLAAERAAQQAEAHRKLSYRGNSATWGVQARVQISAHLVQPNADDPSRLDLAICSGLVGLRRLREDVPWAIATVRRFSDDGSVGEGADAEAVDPRFAGVDVPPLLGDFCSDPLPELRVVPSQPGTTQFELVEGPVGKTAAATCVTGWFCRSCENRYRDPSNQYGEHLVNLHTPVETLVHDLYVHHDIAVQIRPYIAMYSQIPSGPIYPNGGRDRGRLPLYESLRLLGHPPDTIMPEVPAYGEIIETMMHRLGGDASMYHGFRLSFRHPPIPAIALIGYRLPDPPA
ncbi:MAG: hypothetical protein KDA25_02900 [Phycisphaerales bacterium]|nr:hypothetical protein [Phycisphaerales bacterium]